MDENLLIKAIDRIYSKYSRVTYIKLLLSFSFLFYCRIFCVCFKVDKS